MATITACKSPPVSATSSRARRVANSSPPERLDKKAQQHIFPSWRCVVRDPGARITAAGMACNLALSLAKLTGGWAMKSDILVADGWHSMSDLIADVFTLLVVSAGLKSTRKTTSNERIQTLGALVLSAAVLVGGSSLGLHSLGRLTSHFSAQTKASLVHDADESVQVGVVWIAVLSVAVKEWLYRSTMRIADLQGSALLASNAAHHRMDSMAGLVTVAAVVGAVTIRDAGWIDPLGGLVVSLLVIRSSGAIVLQAIG